MKLLLTVVNLILWLSLLAWPVGLLMCGFMFDAPGSESNPITQALAISIFLYPVPVLIGTTCFMRNRKIGSLRQLLGYTLISLIGPAAFLLFMRLLIVKCGGDFACH